MATIYALGENILNEKITATQAASHCGVALCTITKWVREGRLTPVGTHPATGRNLYLLVDVAKAEIATRKRARRTA